MSDSLPEWRGYCPICESEATFRAYGTWYRDQLLCLSCENHSIPRERALMIVLENERANWRRLSVHESSPASRGVSLKLARQCPGYIQSQYFSDVPLGAVKAGVHCQDLARQTFPDETFDVVVTQDVMEHVFDPDAVHREIWRTLKPGGLHILTTPVRGDLKESERKANLLPDGSIEHLAPPKYHGNPIDDAGSLVTFVYGYDIADLIAEAAPFDVEIRRFNDRTRGIIGPYTEVIVCRKPLSQQSERLTDKQRAVGFS